MLYYFVDMYSWSRGEILTATALGVMAIVLGLLTVSGVGFWAGYTIGTQNLPIVSPTPQPTVSACEFNAIKEYHALAICTGGGQLCNVTDDRFISLAQASAAQLTYTVNQYPGPLFNGQPSGHCSSVRTQLTVDDQLAGVSPFLGWKSGPGWAADPQGRPLSYTFDLGTLSAGNHKVSLRFEGTPGGCNLGTLNSVGGPVVVKARTGNPSCPLSSTSLTPTASTSASPTPSSSGFPAICSDGLDNDGDGKIDNADSVCHTDHDSNNSASYQPLHTSEQEAVCSDGLDNDGDTKIDSADPGCHTDGNVNNVASYDPNDPDEKDTFDPGGVKEID